MPINFHIAGLLLGSILIAVGLKSGDWRPLVLGIAIFGLACFELGNVLS